MNNGVSEASPSSVRKKSVRLSLYIEYVNVTQNVLKILTTLYNTITRAVCKNHHVHLEGKPGLDSLAPNVIFLVEYYRQ